MAGRYLNVKDFVIDEEFKNLLPVLTDEEQENLKESLLKYGLLDPIKIWLKEDGDKSEYIIVDGHNRYKIMQENGMEFQPWNDYKVLDELKTRDDVKQ